MSREDLNLKSRKELMEIAKEKNVVGRWDLTKPQLIDEIMVFIDMVPVEQEAVEETPTVAPEQMYVRDTYIDNAAIGVLVAFRDDKGKVRSAKIEKKSTTRRKLMLVTEYGAKFVVEYKDVLWVRTGARWPRAVYDLLREASHGKTKTAE